jgi:hypothetical protein
MTTAASTRQDQRPSATTTDRARDSERHRGPITGWYDPDGAGWESDVAEAFEAYESVRAMPPPAAARSNEGR